MAASSIKVSELPIVQTISSADRVVLLSSSSNTYTLATIPTKTLINYLGRIVTIPLTSKGSLGDKSGDFCFDNNYIYVCSSNYVAGGIDIWKRVSLNLTTW